MKKMAVIFIIILDYKNACKDKNSKLSVNLIIAIPVD